MFVVCVNRHNAVGTIVANVPTAKCIIIDLSIPTELKI